MKTATEGEDEFLASRQSGISGTRNEIQAKVYDREPITIADAKRLLGELWEQDLRIAKLEAALRRVTYEMHYYDKNPTPTEVAEEALKP